MVGPRYSEPDESTRGARAPSVGGGADPHNCLWVHVDIYVFSCGKSLARRTHPCDLSQGIGGGCQEGAVPMATILKTRPLMVLGNADDGIPAMKLHPRGLSLFIICSACCSAWARPASQEFMGVLCTA